MTGVIVLTNKTVLKTVIAVVFGCCLLSYFAKPKASYLEFVTPKDELPTYAASFPGNTRLSDRVIKSYDLAMVLVQTPYTQNNVTSLEMIREWARDKFHSDPDFLHPVSLILDRENRDTVFGAVGYNLLAPAKFWLEGLTAHFLKSRIASFHNSGAFNSFSKAYFDFFGKDSEAATLLSLYESGRAKQAVDVLLWSLVWLVGTCTNIGILVCHKRNDFFGTLQKVVASLWLLVSVQYLFQAWNNGPCSVLTSAILSLGIAAYMYKPIALVENSEDALRLVYVKLAPRWVALATWLTMSLFSIQILTWVRTGLPNGSDPITLLLCSIAGNFLHEPAAQKRLITVVVATIWLATTIWCWRQREKVEPFAVSEDESLKTLERSVDLQLTR